MTEATRQFDEVELHWIGQIMRAEKTLPDDFWAVAAVQELACLLAKLTPMLPDYQKVERRIELSVLGSFGIDYLPPEIKKADRIMFATEQRALMNNHDKWKWCGEVEPLDVHIECLSPEDAYQAFYARGMELWAKYVGLDRQERGA